MRFAETKISDLIVQNETRVLEFSDFGKRFIVSHNLSPDAFVQLSMVTAYHRLYGDARRSSAEHLLIATKALRLHSYGPDAHCR